MKIEVIVDPARLPPAPSLASRVAPAAEAATNGTQGSRRPGGTRGGGVGRGGRRPRRSERPPKSVADLDAEMEDYTATSNGPAAPAATTA
ncbi:hypothetical protein EWM64_g3930 [Hericium alpestre]|uniref:Chromatin target of PRMT1 protein C-terminal domain-containing protein n=1 Tax=Hericium alpestre TaxID=135208 RepID=A0A4Z0A031_9AGAM|nr:hypothetical protein EWM64_g3930 [Hericium alpestre]